jgi:hypothetical protein
MYSIVGFIWYAQVMKIWFLKINIKVKDPNGEHERGYQSTTWEEEGVP